MRISREELYRRVWETPVRTLAKEFDISDVGLAKACRKHKIPLPPVGHWTKVQHGKAVTKLPLPESDSNTDVYLEANRFRIPPPPPIVEEQKPPAWQVLMPTTTKDLAPVAAATFQRLSNAKPDGRGMVSCHGDSVFNCELTPEAVERAVRILHAVETALSSVGAKLTKAAKEKRVQVERDGHSVVFRLHEQYTRTEFVIENKQYSWMNRKEFTYKFTGKLTFQIEGYFDGQKTWSDGVRDRLDAKLAQIVTGLVGALESIKNREMERERQRLEWAERERVREELERKRRMEEEFRRQLLTEVKAWSECEEGLAYLQKVRSCLQGRSAEVPEATRVWLSRAEQALTEMNPITRRIETLIAPDGSD